MSIDHALINALSTHMIHIKLNMIFYTHIEHSPTKRFIKSIIKKSNKIRPPSPHTHTLTVAETGY